MLPFRVEKTVFMVIAGVRFLGLEPGGDLVQPLGFFDTVAEANACVARFPVLKPSIHVILRES